MTVGSLHAVENLDRGAKVANLWALSPPGLLVAGMLAQRDEPAVSEDRDGGYGPLSSQTPCDHLRKLRGDHITVAVMTRIGFPVKASEPGWKTGQTTGARLAAAMHAWATEIQYMAHSAALALLTYSRSSSGRPISVASLNFLHGVRARRPALQHQPEVYLSQNGYGD